MTEEETTPEARTGDDPGTQTEEPSIKELIGELSTDDLNELILSAAPDKFVSKDRVDEIVTERLNSEREQRKAEAERKALEEQNEFKELYEKEKETRTDLEEKHRQEAEARRNDLIRFELRDALRNEGINAERLPLAFKIADTSSVEVKDGSVEGIEGVVESLKKDSPEWFGSDERPSGSRPSPPPSGPTATQADKEAKDAELRRIGSAL